MGATSSFTCLGATRLIDNARKCRRKFSEPHSYTAALHLQESPNGISYRLYADKDDIRAAVSMGFMSNNNTRAWTKDPKVAIKFIKFADDKTAAHIITGLLTSKEG